MRKDFIEKDAIEQKSLDAGQLPWRVEGKEMGQESDTFTVQVTVKVLTLVFIIKNDTFFLSGPCEN